MKHILTEEFRQTAAAAHKAFPRQLSKLIVLLTPNSDKPVYASPEVAHHLPRDKAAIRKAVRAFARNMQELHIVGAGADRNYNFAGTTTDIIGMMTNGPSLRHFSRKYTREMDALFILDHELAHHIVKNAFPDTMHVSPLAAESAADAFAMLRHIQRFGKDTNSAGNLSALRASWFLLYGKGGYYTSDALDGAMAAAEKMGDKFSTLPLEDTARLAASVVRNTLPSSETMARVARAYAPIAKLYAATNNDAEVYLKVINIMRRHRSDAAIFNAGKRYLSDPAIMKFMTATAKTDAFWQKALEMINGPPQAVRAQRHVKLQNPPVI
jgi:hypothetical protein